jgi:spore coat protein U-like protein
MTHFRGTVRRLRVLAEIKKRKEGASMKKLLILTTVLGAVALSGTAMAADTASVAVSASVTGACKVTTGAGTVAFGNLDPTNPTLVTGTVVPPVVWCTNGQPVTIADNLGLHSNGAGVFRMVGPTSSDFIAYTFTHATTLAGAGPNTNLALAIAATVPAANYAGAVSGSYSDTVTLTFTP